MFGIFGGPQGLNPATMMPYTWAPPPQLPVYPKPSTPSTYVAPKINWGNPLVNLQIPQGINPGWIQPASLPTQNPTQNQFNWGNPNPLTFAPFTPLPVKINPIAPTPLATNTIKK
jgi:hypothetical protein